MSAETNIEKDILTKKDFQTDQMIRWCPGCGDYVILSSMQKAFSQLGKPRHEIVCVSGIGCSSRLPYYMNTFGIHSIHGRAAATASGVKLSRPDLSVWVITGDGDSMAIGGNHFIHAVRRNMDLNIIIFNNKIYGMTKGQTSPTTPMGQKTKTSPEGSFENPFTIGELTMGAQGTFFARVPDNNPKLMEDVIVRAGKHKGTSVVEVLQNCVIFTDGIHEEITGKDTKDDNQLVLEHGKPMIWGKEKRYGLKLNGMSLEKVALGEGEEGNGRDHPDLLVHDVHHKQPELQIALARMQLPDFPVAMGVLRQVEAPTFDDLLHGSVQQARDNTKHQKVSDLFQSGNTWKI